MSSQLQKQLLKCPDHDMYLMVAAPVGSLTLLSGWSSRSQASLQHAVDTVVTVNPYLAGKLVSLGPDEVAIEPSSHVISLVMIDGPAEFTVPKTLSEKLTKTQSLESLFPALPIGSGQLEAGSPLFSVAVATLPGDYACICVQMSHMLGDGSCYYQVCAQLNAAANSLPLSNMEWVPSPKSAVIAPHFTADDEFTALKSWVPAFVEKLQSFKPRATATVLDMAALKSLKTKYTANAGGKVEFLSTNDIIVAGLNEVTGASMSGMFANMRGRKEQANAAQFAGNYERNIIYPRTAAANDPVYVRSKLATDFYHYEAGEMPMEAMVKCDLSVTTSWCQLTTFVEPPGTEAVVHVPPSAFVTAIPFELIVCFKADKKGTIGMLHNLDLEDPAFKGRIAASSIFKRIVSSTSSSARGEDATTSDGPKVHAVTQILMKAPPRTPEDEVQMIDAYFRAMDISLQGKKAWIQRETQMN